MIKSYKYWMHCAIMIVLTFGVGFMPPLGGNITPLGMDVLGVFLGLLYGWCFIDFFWTSCFGFLALGLTSYTTIAGALSTGFSAQITLMLIFLFAFVGYLIQSGFVEIITGWFLSRKISHGKPWVLFFLILLSCGILGMLGLGFGAIFLTWAILYRMFDAIGYKKGDWVVSYLVYGTVILISISNAALPFTTMPLLFKPWLGELGLELPDIQWIIWQMAYFMLYLILFILVGKYVFKIDVKKFVEHAEEVANVYQVQKLTFNQKVASAMVILFLLITLLPAVLPATSAIRLYLAQYGLFGGILVVIMLTAVIRVDGKPITNWSSNIKNGINWDMIMMLAITTPIANALESADSGILSTVIATLTPYLDGMSPWIYSILVLVMILLITQFTHNVVVVIAFSPTVLSLGLNLGANVIFLAAAICVISQSAFLTPAASSGSALVHSNTDWIDVKQAYIFGVVAVALALIVVMAVYPLGQILF